MIYGSISGTIWFLTFLVFKIGILHSYRIKNKSSIIIRVFLTSMAGCIFSNLILGKSIAEVLIGLVTMFSFFILYMPFYYTISSSVSIQTLVMLSDRDSRTCPLDELKDTFASTEIVDHKLKSMVNSGVLLSDGRAYRTTPKGKLIASVFRSIKKNWNLGPGG